MTLVPSRHKVRCKTDQHGWPAGCEVIEEPPLLPTLVETIGKILDPDFELPPETRKRFEEGPVRYARASQLNANPQPTVIHGRVYEQGSPPPPVIRGRVEKGGGRDGGGGVGDVLGGIADIILTGIQVAAPIFLAYLQAKNSGGGGTTVVYENNDLSSYQSQPRQIIEAPQVQPSRVQYTPSQSNPNLSRDALNRIKRPEFQAGTPVEQLMNQGRRAVQGIVNAGEQFRRQFDTSISRPETPYNTYEPPAPGISMAEILNPTNQAGRSFIQEYQAWIQHNLSKAQRLLTWQDRLMAEQVQLQAIQQQQTLDAQRQLAQAQQELAQAQLNNLRREIFERGERATGRKSHLSPKRVRFNDEGDLTDKLWDHFYQGQGQPVEVDLRKLNLTEDLNMPRLLRGFNSSAVTLMRFPNPSKKALQGHFKAKNPTIGANPKVTHVILGKPFTDVALDISREDDPEQWAAFGRLAVDVNDVHIMVDHTKKIVTVEADLGPSSATRKIQPDLIEDFDFNPDPGRDFVGELGTRAVHHFAPPGSTSYQIRRVPGTVSHFKREYSFKEFFGY